MSFFYDFKSKIIYKKNESDNNIEHYNLIMFHPNNYISLVISHLQYSNLKMIYALSPKAPYSKIGQ